MSAFAIAAAIVVGAATLYFAVRSRDFRKFLSGAFFVSGGIQLYLSLAKVAVPLLGTSFVQTPEVGGVRGIVHSVLCLITFYFGFVQKPKEGTRAT